MREHQVVIVRKLRSNLRIFDEIATQPTAARKALLLGSKNAFSVIPWLDHGIQKTIKNI
ncbi:hypothetical protein [Rickettsia tamurae]|uniref:hypothetical protein n=1 Tax=Rickettsia tamurae TaxID=334545 RepID=UPI001F48058A|nr:hypothetical protein [Rickettsia tamurae]